MPFFNQARQNFTKLNKTSPFIIAFSSISLPCFDFGIQQYTFFHDPVCLRSKSSHVVQILFPISTPWFPTASLLWVIKYSAMQRSWLGQRKQGKGGTRLQFMFVFQCGYRATRPATFPSYIIFLLCQLLTLGVLNKNFSSLLFLKQTHN